MLDRERMRALRVDLAVHAGAWLRALTSDTPGDEHRCVPGEALLLGLVVALAFGLRFSGIRLGLPFIHHWDERFIVASARSMLEKADAIPLQFQYGATLMRLTAGAFRVAERLGLSVAKAPVDYELALRWVGRAVTASIAASGALAGYLTARAIFRRGDVALWAALAYACAAELVWHARYLVTDASVVSLTFWTLCFSALYLEKRLLTYAAAAVLVAGVTASFKLTGVSVVLLPIGALVLRAPFGIARARPGEPALLTSVLHRALLAASVPAVLAVFVALNPYLISEWRRSLPDLERIIHTYRDGHMPPVAYREPGLPHLASALHYLFAQAFATNAALSLSLSLLGLGGVVLSLCRPRPAMLLASLHAALVVLGMAWPNRAFLTRMYLPALPLLCLGFGAGVQALIDACQRFGAPARPLRAALAAAFGIALVAPASAQALVAQRLSRDPRDRALDFVATRAAAQGHSVSVAFSPTVAKLGAAWGVAHDMYGALTRANVAFKGDVATSERARELATDYVVIASLRNANKISPFTILPFENDWLFTTVEGYRELARFEPNPCEERFDIIPIWYGRISVIVLARSE